MLSAELFDNWKLNHLGIFSLLSFNGTLLWKCGVKSHTERSLSCVRRGQASVDQHTHAKWVFLGLSVPYKWLSEGRLRAQTVAAAGARTHL